MGLALMGWGRHQSCLLRMLPAGPLCCISAQAQQGQGQGHVEPSGWAWPEARVLSVGGVLSFSGGPMASTVWSGAQ